MNPQEQARLIADFERNPGAASAAAFLRLFERLDTFEREVGEAIGASVAVLAEKIQAAGEMAHEGSKASAEAVSEAIKPLLAAVHSIRIVKGDPGEDYVLTEGDKSEIAARIAVPVVEKVVERTEVVREVPVVTEVASDQTPEEVREALEGLPEGEKLPQAAVEGLEEALDKLRELAGKGGRSGGFWGVRGGVQYVDLTPLCDGATKTFPVPKHTRVVGLRGTQFPIIYRPGTDFTTGNGTLTLTAEVAAPEAGQTLVFEYIK